MKHLVIVALAFLTINAFGQEIKPKLNSDFTPEQQAILKTKHMALQLDLNDVQQSKIQQINLEQAKDRLAKREQHKKLKATNTVKQSSDDRFKMKSDRLDKAIAHKQQMKSILSQDQFEKWEKNRHRKTRIRKNSHKPRMRHHSGK